MLPKPPACVGCPLQQDGMGFVPDEIVPGAEVFVLAQNPGANEEHDGRPMVGRTGQAMMSEYFPRAGLVRGKNVSIGNVLRCRWIKRGKRVDTLPPAAILTPAMRHCMTAYYRPPPETKLVVAQGALAWRAMGQKTKITDWRGFLASEG